MVSLAKVSISDLIKDVKNYLDAKDTPTNESSLGWHRWFGCFGSGKACRTQTQMNQRIQKLKKIEHKYLQTNSTDKAIEIFKNYAQEDEEKYICTICLVNSSNIALVPCGHTIMCDECSAKIDKRTIVSKPICPICRKAIRKKIKLFFS